MITEHVLARALEVCAAVHFVQIPALVMVQRDGNLRPGTVSRSEWVAFGRASATALAILVAGLGLVVALGATEIAHGGGATRLLAGVLALSWTHRAFATARLYAAVWPRRGTGLVIRWLLTALFTIVSAVYWTACWRCGAAGGAS